MTILLASLADSKESWERELRLREVPGELRVWPETGDLEDIEYAIVAKPPEGLLASLPNLKAILSIWAGVDHITCDPSWPKHVPIYRMIEPGLTGGMAEFVLSQVLNLHLGNFVIAAAQRRGEWLRAPRGAYGMEPLVGDRTVGVLGLGEMGRNTAAKLAQAGFKVVGWSRSLKELDGVTCFTGDEGFDQMLRRSEILVNLLPLTPETENILNADSLSKLPRGAGLVNTGRGQHIVDDDLLFLLNSGHLSHAVLDVFRTEPLPENHAFWDHPQIQIYPHIASVTRVVTGVQALLKTLSVLGEGGIPEGYFNPDRGY